MNASGRPDLPPGVTVKFVEPDDATYPKWARGKWATDYGGGHGVDGYDTREEALDCTWHAWRSPPDSWVVWADHETARADASERDRNDAIAALALAHSLAAIVMALAERSDELGDHPGGPDVREAIRALSRAMSEGLT